MSDQLPEMIPVPDQAPQRENIPELSRKLSPEEERSVLLNFMGNMYGEAKKMDGNIVNPSSTLQRGNSEEIKKQIEQVYTQPLQSASQPVQVAPPQEPQVQIEQPQVPVIQRVEDNQLSFNFNVSEKDNLINEVSSLVEKVNYNTKQIGELNDKIDKLINNIKTTSLPIKKRAKKIS